MRVPSNIRVLINPNSGIGVSMRVLLETFQEVWDCDGRRISYQFSKSAQDGCEKARVAIAEGVDTIIVVGGDGMINTIGSELIHQPVNLGVIPTGSGNGFARHFDIPLQPRQAIKRLVNATPQEVDVGTANGQPFFATCSLAWDAALVKTFEKSPVRGILPYFFAATYELFEYKAQSFTVCMDEEAPLVFDHPMLFTIANLTQYGGGAQIAPHAKANDGYLWLTAALKSDVAKLIPSLPKLFDGTIDRVEGIHTHRFKRMTVTRLNEGPIQVDGEVVPSTRQVELGILPGALRVLVP